MSLLDLVVVRQDPADRHTIEAVAVDDLDQRHKRMAVAGTGGGGQLIQKH